MPAFAIKIIALITMVIDHLGYFFFPKVELFRLIGRLSFPLFAWAIANGARYTKNINLYLARIGVFATISQIPYLMANRLVEPSFSKLNVLFTLFIGLVIIKFISHKNLIIRFLVTSTLLIMATQLKLDYGIENVLSIITFYLFFNKPPLLIPIQSFLYSFNYLYHTFLLSPTRPLTLALKYGYFAPFAVFSLPITFLYNHKKGKNLKYLFYLFYPLQFVFFYITGLFLIPS
ncbi:TraX family protein [Patescibacteria group bacterium]